MTAPRTTVRCPDKRFRTARYAKNWAWRIEPDRSKRMVPYQCERCTAWHLAEPGRELIAERMRARYAQRPPRSP